MDGLLGFGSIVLSTGVGLGLSMTTVWVILNLAMKHPS